MPFPPLRIGLMVAIRPLAQMECLGLPLVIATGAQQPRFPTDAQGVLVPGRHLAGVVAATSKFFRQIGTTWLTENKSVQGGGLPRQAAYAPRQTCGHGVWGRQCGV